MDKATRRSLSSKEFALLRATKAKEMEGLDEDELVELHSRVRRARNKYSTLHRRKASAQVQKDRARGKAAAKPVRAAAKTEVFEDALARVSRRLGIVAQQTADALKAERIAAARGEAPGGKKAKKAKKGKKAKVTKQEKARRKAQRKADKATKGKGAKSRAKGSSARTRREVQTPSRKKAQASTLAKGARRQARRDAH